MYNLIFLLKKKNIYCLNLNFLATYFEYPAFVGIVQQYNIFHNKAEKSRLFIFI